MLNINSENISTSNTSTDINNAKKFIELHGQNVRYCNSSKKWHIWDGKRWKVDETQEILKLAKDVSRKIKEEVFKSPDKAEELIKRAKSLESRSKIESMIKLSEPEVAITPDQFDTNNWLLNCENNTINLKTGELLPHNKEDFITKIIPVTFDPKADCPKFRKFLDDITGGNKNLQKFIQKAIGYSLTGETSEQCLFILHGTGLNGKSTFLETIRALLGDYAMQSENSIFMNERKEVIRHGLARLKDARLVTTSEGEENSKLAQSIIKDVTGGDRITARPLYEKSFEFNVTFKIFMAVNHMPIIKTNDKAIWRRIEPIPFSVTIPEEKRNPNLKNELKEELAGILNWAIEGCLLWQQERLNPPKEVIDALIDYKEEILLPLKFKNNCCMEEKGAKTSSEDLYSGFEEWCKNNGYEPDNKNEFGKILKHSGLVPYNDGKKRGYKGIKLKTL